MTKRIVPDDERKRAEKACVNCRRARVKCELTDGSHAKPGQTCARCARYEVDCQYARSRRLGRPRRKAETRELQFESHNEGSSASSPGRETHSNLPVLHITPAQPNLDPFSAVIDQYKYKVHHFIPILPSDETELSSAIRNASPLLISAILVASYPEASSQHQVPIINPTLSDIQAATLLALSYYGRDDAEKAILFMTAASTCLVRLGVSTMDQGSIFQPPLSNDPVELEMWRRVWWECWELEIVLFAVPDLETNPIILGNENCSPKFPGISDAALGAGVQETSSDMLYIRSLGLLYQVINTTKQQAMDFELLTQLSRTGVAIYTLGRQNWAASSSLVRTSQPSPRVHDLVTILYRERSHLASLIAASSVAYLHMRCIPLMIPDAVDASFNPLPGTPKFLSNICQQLFASLRDTINYHSSLLNQQLAIPNGYLPTSAPTYPPMFSTIAKLASFGAFFSLTRSPSLQTQDTAAQIARAAIIVDLQLAESTIHKQCPNWPKNKDRVKEIREIRKKMQKSITCNMAQAIIGVKIR